MRVGRSRAESQDTVGLRCFDITSRTDAKRVDVLGGIRKKSVDSSILCSLRQGAELKVLDDGCILP